MFQICDAPEGSASEPFVSDSTAGYVKPIERSLVRIAIWAEVHAAFPDWLDNSTTILQRREDAYAMFARISAERGV